MYFTCFSYFSLKSFLWSFSTDWWQSQLEFCFSQEADTWNFLSDKYQLESWDDCSLPSTISPLCLHSNIDFFLSVSQVQMVSQVLTLTIPKLTKMWAFPLFKIPVFWRVEWLEIHPYSWQKNKMYCGKLRIPMNSSLNKRFKR